MTASLQAKPNGTQGALQVNGTDVVVFGAGGIESGVKREAVSKMPGASGAVAASGLIVEFTSIPDWAEELVLSCAFVSVNGSAGGSIQLGSASGGYVTAGYISSVVQLASTNTVAQSSITSGFNLPFGAAADWFTGEYVFRRTSANIWVANVAGNRNGYISLGAGNVNVGGTLDRLRINGGVNGTDAFDGGFFRLFWR